MNPIPWFLGAFFAGIYFGWKAGHAAAYEALGVEPLSFEDHQRLAAQEGLQ